jgi:serine/threonine protein kinase
MKLENVMMTDVSDSSVPKLVDFGLAKMIGPGIKAEEPFGTLGYVAPEILEKKPYSFQCDLWSLGCIVYALLTSSLPFDHDSQKETIRMTCEDDVIFDPQTWKAFSVEAKDLIFRLLIKNPEKRITLDEVIEHAWFRKIKTKIETKLQLHPPRKSPIANKTLQ